MHEVMWNLTLTVMLQLGIQVDEAIVLLELIPDYIYIYIFILWKRTSVLTSIMPPGEEVQGIGAEGMAWAERGNPGHRGALNP